MDGEHSLHDFAMFSADAALTEAGSSRDGLSAVEAQQRLVDSGPNVIGAKKRSGVIAEFLSHFYGNPLVIILLLIAIISFYIGEMANAVIISIMILLSVLLDFVQEHKADRAAQRLKDRVVITASVLRDGQKLEVKAADICVGDIVMLSAGDLVPADARLIEAKDLFINQSSLTGESIPVEKSAQPIVVHTTSLSDLSDIVFFGSSVVSGSAMAVVVKTGAATQFGKIAKSLGAAREENEFERGVRGFGYMISKVIVILVLLVFFIASLIHHNVLESFLFAIAVAVGLTPELLPMIMSVTLSIGSVRMAKKGVIVKRLSSIATFGSVDVLCTDKTGTLTEDRIALVKYTDAAGKEYERTLLFTYLNSLNETGIKNPLDEAVLRFRNPEASKHALDFVKVDEIPFDFVRKKVSVVVERLSQQGRKDGARKAKARQPERLLITKGAPEEIFRTCVAYERGGKAARLTESVRRGVTRIYHDMSRDGYRVLAVAYKRVDASRDIYEARDETDMVLLGFVAFLDPPKAEAGRMLEELRESGIDVKIITGDNELVTQCICSKIGLRVDGVLLGSELDALDEDALRVRAERTTIFARFSPDQKNRVIHALKANGHVVGYLGDGINDAPSLRNADVGISVDNAVDVAKESADIILTHKSLDELRDGVQEGRKTFGNTLKYIMMGISSNFGNMFSVLGAVIFIPFLPMLPLQILLNNLIYDFSQITIPSDNVDDEYVLKPKRWDTGFIRAFMFVFGPISSLFDFITFFVLYVAFGTPAAVFQTGWFLESLATQTLVIHIIRTRQTPFLKSTGSAALIISTVACVAIGWIIPYTPLGVWFGFVPIPTAVMLALTAIVIAYLIVVEAAKRRFYAYYDAKHEKRLRHAKLLAAHHAGHVV